MGVVARAPGVLVNRDPSDTDCGSRWTHVAGICLAQHQPARLAAIMGARANYPNDRSWPIVSVNIIVNMTNRNVGFAPESCR
jgi:hypothetical protein